MSLEYELIKYEIIRLYYLLINKMGEISRTIGGTDSLFNKFALENPPAINLQNQADTFIGKLSDLESDFVSEVYDTNNKPELEEIEKRLMSTLKVLEVDTKDITASLLNTSLSPITNQTTENIDGVNVKKETKSVKNKVDYLLDTIHYEYPLLSKETMSTYNNYLRKKYYSEIIKIFADERYGGTGVGYGDEWEKIYEIDPENKKGTQCIDFVKNVLRLLLNPGTSTPTLPEDKDDNAVEIPETFGLKSIGTYEPKELLNLDQEYIYAIAIFQKNYRCGTQTNNRFDSETWYDEHQHIRRKMFYNIKDAPTVTEFGTVHAALLNFEDGKLMLTHQTDDDNTPFKHDYFINSYYYNHPENYLIEVYPVK